MMIHGKYRINPENAAAWHKLIQVCRSLAAEGAEYSTEIQRFGERSVVTVTATGGKVCKQRKSAVGKRVSCIPAKLTEEQIRRRLESAKSTMASSKKRLPINLREQWSPQGCRDAEWMLARQAKRLRNRRIGQAVAKLIAQHGLQPGRDPWKWSAEDYAQLDSACGQRVARASKLSGGALARGGYLGYIVRTETGSWRYGFKGQVTETDAEPTQHDSAVMVALRVKAECDYWREMERLSGQRDKWKPGLTDETFYADDEVSTHAA